MKKYLAICSMFALMSASQAEVLFQEDFSGYTTNASPLVAPQVGTWTQNGGTIFVATYHTLLDGTVGPCMEFVDGTTHLVPSLDANLISYTATPIKITYDFLMRRDQYNDQAFALFAENSEGEKVTYSKVYDANGTQDWISMYGKAPSGIENFLLARDSWYTVEMELPIMPSSGTFSTKYTIYDATGTVIYTKVDQTSWSENAGSNLVDKIVLQAGGGVADVTSVLIDNILVETALGPTPEIGDIAVEYLGANDLALTWNSGVGFNYTLWEAPELASPTLWSTNQSGIPGGAGSVTVTTSVSAVQAFYKVSSE